MAQFLRKANASAVLPAVEEDRAQFARLGHSKDFVDRTGGDCREPVNLQDMGEQQVELRIVRDYDDQGFHSKGSHSPVCSKS